MSRVLRLTPSNTPLGARALDVGRCLAPGDWGFISVLDESGNLNHVSAHLTAPELRQVAEALTKVADAIEGVELKTFEEPARENPYPGLPPVESLPLSYVKKFIKYINNLEVA